ncbi:hypothetical protein E5A73_11420 [Sphingomonas gei]|uniref:DUF4440 domain-containing protein n=1 Tax=Sphingomonas gei TaxID=1395960 RepID=A0A4V3QZA3_9SPHN|nr:hypothetical protein [Sphingomonas gei]TGX53442.1 hypothetical protein E5A73_11420 [Sphingomonas gei]
MLAVLLLQAVTPETAVEAERAFSRAALTQGQWTAFREFAATDSTMFVPAPVKAQDWLRDRKDPPRSVEWWPTDSYVSCDGNLAVNTGGWKRPDGSLGYFTTVWLRQPDGRFKWLVDHGDGLKIARVRLTDPKVMRASCSGAKTRGHLGDSVINPEEKSEIHFSSDGSLIWQWRVTPDGARMFKASLWTGTAYKTVITDQVPAPK